MIIRLVELVSYYISLPLWLIILFLVVHTVAFVLCLHNNVHDSSSKPGKSSRNTIHTAFWLGIIISLPFLGIVLYIFGSVLPYKRWKQSHPNTEEFTHTYKMCRKYIPILFISGTLGAVIQPLLYSQYMAGGINYAFELSFFCWILLTTADWLKHYRGKAIYLSILKNHEENAPVAKAEDLFGIKHFKQSDLDDSASLYCEAAHAARMAADDLFSEMDSVPVKIDGTAYVYDKLYKYKVLTNQQQFKKDNIDISQAQYIGRGITRYIYFHWNENREQCVELAMFRAVPRMKYWAIRSLICIFIILVCFTPLFADMHLGIMEFIEKIIM